MMRKCPIVAVLDSMEEEQFRDTFRLKKEAKTTGNGRLQGQTYDF